MQLFPCPFCGPRDETEFHFEAEAGRSRPEPAADVSAIAWSAYLDSNRNARGWTTEIWRHTTCGELFIMERNTLSHSVAASREIVRGETEAASPEARR